jgi:hypothetical protein
MTQVGYTEVIDHYEVEVVNNTKIIQIYYSSNGEKVTLKPGQKGIILRSRLITVSNEELLRMTQEPEQPRQPRVVRPAGKPRKVVKAKRGKTHGDRSGSEGQGTPGVGQPSD